MTATPFDLPNLPSIGETTPWKTYGQLESQALAVLARLDGMMIANAKADLFWITWLMKEAQYSNVIEGTMTTFDEVIGESAGIVVSASRKDDVQEVLNYRDAMLDGLDEIISKKRHISLSFVKGLHSRLLKGARGMYKTPGEPRKVQVHIGRPGEGIVKAIYIPPNPFLLQSLLDNWLSFLSRDDLNPIVQAAVMHAQFEMIHPFLDGNGRMGRLLITLFLADKKILSTPCFYMSAYLQSHRDRYYETIGMISKNGDWDSWIKFFLNGVIEHCTANVNLLINMTSLYEESKEKFANATNSSFAINSLDYIFANPIFSIPGLRNAYRQNLSQQVTSQLVNKLTSAKLIEKVYSGVGRRPSVYRFPALLKLLS